MNDAQIERKEKLRAQNGSCSDCGAPMRLVTKYEFPFLACTNYRYRRFTAPWNPPVQAEESTEQRAQAGKVLCITAGRKAVAGVA